MYFQLVFWPYMQNTIITGIPRYRCFPSDNFPPKIVNAPIEINATLHETVHLNVTAEDNDTISFHVINRPAGATVKQIGNVLYFTWHVTSSQKVAGLRAISITSKTSTFWLESWANAYCLKTNRKHIIYLFKEWIEHNSKHRLNKCFTVRHILVSCVKNLSHPP